MKNVKRLKILIFAWGSTSIYEAGLFSAQTTQLSRDTVLLVEKQVLTPLIEYCTYFGQFFRLQKAVSFLGKIQYRRDSRLLPILTILWDALVLFIS